MPVFRDVHGRLYRIPSAELESYAIEDDGAQRLSGAELPPTQSNYLWSDETEPAVGASSYLWPDEMEPAVRASSYLWPDEMEPAVGASSCRPKARRASRYLGSGAATAPLHAVG